MNRWGWLAIGGVVLVAIAGTRQALKARLLASPTATARGIDNAPPPSERTRLDWLAARAEEVLRILRERWATATLSSGYRSPALNAAVDGSPTSRHARMLAFDVRAAKPSATTYHEMARYLREHAHRLHVAPRMVIAETAAPHLHLDYFDPLTEKPSATAWRQEKPGRQAGEARQLEALA